MKALLIILSVFLYNACKDKNSFPTTNDSIKKENFTAVDSLIRVDTIAYVNSWKTENYFEYKTNSYIESTKMLLYRNNKIQLSQRYYSAKKTYENKTIKYNSTIFDIDNLYSKQYGKKFTVKYNLMENLVTVKHYTVTIKIDFVLMYSECCCDFCNDVVIVSLIINGNNSCTIKLHDENLELYKL